MVEADIKKMSVPERLRAMEAIWDSLLQDEIEIAAPDWHEAILNERRKKINAGTARFLSIEEAKSRRR